MQRNKVSFKGKKIYIGIDVHLRNWQVAVITESGLVKRLSIKADAKELFDFLKKHYPDGDYMAVYESGFSGFSTHYALTGLGINCIVIHAADVPTTQYEEAMKTDRIDAEKLARSLRAGLLRGIYVRPKGNIDDRSVIRIRKTMQKQLGGCKSRVKHLLHNHGGGNPREIREAGDALVARVHQVAQGPRAWLRVFRLQAADDGAGGHNTCGTQDVQHHILGSQNGQCVCALPME